jgi:hypothetical protein
MRDLDTSVAAGIAVFFAWLPRMVGALAVLLVGYFVGRAVEGAVRPLLLRAGFDRTLHGGHGGGFIKRAVSSPSGLVGRITFWAVMLGALSLAVSVLGIPALTAFMAAVFAYVPNVLAATLIFLVAGALSAGAAGLISRVMGETATGRVARVVAPSVIMAIASFMILEQLQIAQGVVLITYAAIMGALALGSAIAFGLGGREVAGRILQGAYENNREQVKADVSQGVVQARAEARSLREQLQPEDAPKQAPQAAPAESFYERIGDAEEENPPF